MNRRRTVFLRAWKDSAVDLKTSEITACPAIMERASDAGLNDYIQGKGYRDFTVELTHANHRSSPL